MKTHHAVSDSLRENCFRHFRKPSKGRCESEEEENELQVDPTGTRRGPKRPTSQVQAIDA